VLSVAVLYLISLKPRFSEVHGRVPTTTALAVYLFTDKKTAEAVGLPQASLTPS